MVRERRALREAGGARRVLDVDRVVAGQRRRRAGSAASSTPSPPATSSSQDGVPITTTCASAGQSPRTSLDHRHVVAGLERLGGRPAPSPRTGCSTYDSSWVRYAGLMLTSTAPIFAVAYCTSTHSAQFGAQMPTRSPLLDAQGEQPAGHPVDVAVQLGVGPAAAARAVDQRLPVAEPGHGALQVRPDRVAEQRELGGAAGVGRGAEGSRPCRSSCSGRAGSARASAGRRLLSGTYQGARRRLTPGRQVRSRRWAHHQRYRDQERR